MIMSPICSSLKDNLASMKRKNDHIKKMVPVVGVYRGKVSIGALSYFEALHDRLYIGI